MTGLKEEILDLKKKKNAVILAHTYQPGDVQDIADFVGDSYGLSVEASQTNADVIIFCGVRFMAETAAILNPQREVILPDSSAGCPMADMITPEELQEIKDQYHSHLVMCYVNSTAEIKALSDVCCTSSNALKIANKLPSEKGIIFVPDKHLGSFVQQRSGRELVLWDGFCPTHLRITPEMVKSAREAHPEATILIHPEAPHECRILADEILSTGGMCDFVKKSKRLQFIIATENGLIHTLQKENSDKRFYPLSDEIVCPNMKKGSLEKVKKALDGSGGERIIIEPEISRMAERSLWKMLELSR
jgi:quinolinate synthase